MWTEAVVIAAGKRSAEQSRPGSDASQAPYPTSVCLPRPKSNNDQQRRPDQLVTRYNYGCTIMANKRALVRSRIQEAWTVPRQAVAQLTVLRDGTESIHSRSLCDQGSPLST